MALESADQNKKINTNQDHLEVEICSETKSVGQFHSELVPVLKRSELKTPLYTNYVVARLISLPA